MIDQIKKILAENADPDNAKRMTAYMKHNFSFFGIPASKRRPLIADLLKSTRRKSRAEILTIVRTLWAFDEREFQYIAMDLLVRHLAKLKDSDIECIEHLIVNKSWWDTVDYLANRMVGHHFKKYPGIRDAYEPVWLASSDIWLNRTCLLYQLSYKTNTDEDRLTHHIESLLSKKEFFIQKAIGWSLREYSKTNSIFVRDFVASHEMSGLAAREALKWLNRNEK